MGSSADETSLARALRSQPRGIDLFKVEQRCDRFLDFSMVERSAAMSVMPWAARMRDDATSDAEMVLILQKAHLLGLHTGLSMSEGPEQFRADPERAREDFMKTAGQLAERHHDGRDLGASDAERSASMDGVSGLIEVFLVAPLELSQWPGYAWTDGFLLAMDSRARKD